MKEAQRLGGGGRQPHDPFHQQLAQQRRRPAHRSGQAPRPSARTRFVAHLVAAPDPVQAHEPVEGEEQGQGHHQQDQRQRAGEAPLQKLLDLGGDEHGEHGVPQPAQQGRGHVEADGEDEHQHAAGTDPRQAEREVHPEEGLRSAGPQAVGDLDEIHVDAAHDAVERQHHDRKHDVGHPDDHAGGVVDHPDGFVDDAQADHGLVENAVAAEEHQPGVAAHQDAGEVGQNDSDDEKVAHPLGRGRQRVGQGIAQHQAEQRGLDAYLQRRLQDSDVDGRGQGHLVVPERELGIEDAQPEQSGDGIAEEDQQEQNGRRQQQPCPFGRTARR